jgi:hypothetical protein
MGIGSPGLRTVCAACALQLTVAACLIGAPAALADAVVAPPLPAAAVVDTGTAVVSGTTSGLESVTSAAAANVHTVAATVSDAVAHTPQSVKRRVEISVPVGPTNATSVKTPEVVAAPRTTARPRSQPPARAVVAGLRASEPLLPAKPVRPALKTAHAPRSPLVAPLTISDAASSVETSAPAGAAAAGVGLLLLGLLAFAAPTVPPHALGRRTAPGDRAFRPWSPLLRLERPD